MEQKKSEDNKIILKVIFFINSTTIKINIKAFKFMKHFIYLWSKSLFLIYIYFSYFDETFFLLTLLFE